MQIARLGSWKISFRRIVLTVERKVKSNTRSRRHFRRPVHSIVRARAVGTHPNLGNMLTSIIFSRWREVKRPLRLAASRSSSRREGDSSRRSSKGMRKKRIGSGIIRSYAILRGNNVSSNGASYYRALSRKVPAEPSPRGETKVESGTGFKSGPGRSKYRRDFPR